MDEHMADKIAWIAERDKCNMADLAVQVQNLVKSNVTAMNSICSARGFVPFEHTTDRAEPLTFHVKQQDASQVRIATFKHDVQGGMLTITVTEPVRLYHMQTRWDTETLKCHVVVIWHINGEQKSVTFLHSQLWKAVQFILEPFFFSA